MPVKRHIPAALSLGAALLCGSAVAAFAQAPAPAAPSTPPAATQPAAPAAAPAAGAMDLVHAKATFESACSGCHEPTLATAQRNTRAGWVALVDRMVGFGLTASEPQLNEIVEYLTVTYPAP